MQYVQLVLFQSDPFEASWKGGGRLRFDSAKLGLAQVGSSIALDVMVLCFPLPVISSLQLQTKKKWAVGIIFWLGSFCVLAAVVRMILLNQSIHMVLDSVSFSQVCTYPSHCYTNFPRDSNILHSCSMEKLCFHDSRAELLHNRRLSSVLRATFQGWQGYRINLTQRAICILPPQPKIRWIRYWIQQVWGKRWTAE